jgi:hypothetical protein
VSGVRFALLAATILVAPVSAQQAEPAQKPEAMQKPEPAPKKAPAKEGAADLASKEAAQAGAARAIDWLVTNQHPNGSWGGASCQSLFDDGYAIDTYFAYQVGAHGVATLALLGAEETPPRRAALDKAVRWLADARLPLRGADWDNDAVWSALYGVVALTAVAGDQRFKTEEWRTAVEKRGREFLAYLVKNQVPDGGFGYYDMPTFTRRPKWATSFATACVVPALALAQQLGWLQDPKVLERAAKYVHRCRLPNGAYSYELDPVPRFNGGEHIDNVKGSLGRIQVCQWALRTQGDADVTDERIRWGLGQFVENHRFLQVARMRPVPHEAYYYNASYFFFFGHYYCAMCIGLLPEAEREEWHAKLRPLILQTQRKDGSFNDTLGVDYMIVSGTAFAAMALQAGL